MALEVQASTVQLLEIFQDLRCGRLPYLTRLTVTFESNDLAHCNHGDIYLVRVSRYLKVQAFYITLQVYTAPA